MNLYDKVLECDEIRTFVKDKLPFNTYSGELVLQNGNVFDSNLYCWIRRKNFVMRIPKIWPKYTLQPTALFLSYMTPTYFGGYRLGGDPESSPH